MKSLITFALGIWMGVSYTQVLGYTCPMLRTFPLAILKLEEVTIAGKLCKPY
jgi:hypothetical protein